MPALRRPTRRLAVLAALAFGTACSSGTEPAVPATIQVTTASGAPSVTLVSVGQTVNLTAAVFDQRGDSMTGQTITWSTGAATVATVSPGGIVTAVANGTALITATSGSATGTLTVTVAQVAAAVQKQSGDLQTGQVATALGANLVVRVADALGAAVPSAAVTWAIGVGGGSIAGGNADASGLATATWTPGNAVGTASATATSNGIAVTFTATLTAGPAALITIVAGNSQTGLTGTAVTTQPRVRVTDQFNNLKSGTTVAWTVTAGGGSVNPASGATAANGEAATTWTLGAVAGANALQASAGAGVTVSFGATGVAPGAPTAVAVHVGNNQTSLVNFATNTRPAVRVTDANALPVNNAQVVFTASAGGSVTGGTVNTNASGIAQVGSWTPGTSAGAATLTAAVTGTALTQVFNATAQMAAYNIEIRNIGPAFSPAVATAFANAEALWEQSIYGEQSDVAINTTSACSIAGATIQETVDDLIILARFDSIDGPGQILGSAGPCSIRVSNGLTIYGSMRFDTADVAGLIANGSLDAVILHEMGHVLGFTTGIFNTQAGITQQRICAQNVSSAGLDSHFNCTQAGATNNAVAMFDSIGGTSYTGGSKVPLENCVSGVPASCGAGTLFSHWREFTFFNELMTGYLNSGNPNPLSVLTIAAFADNGYLVNYGAAQSYSRTFTAPAAARGAVVDLSNDEYRGPITVVDERTGRVVRVIRR